MKADKRYEVIKDIPVNGGNSKISKGTLITRTHGVYYKDGVLLSQGYQEDFDALIEDEEYNGWNYLCPVSTKRAFGNSKEEV